MKGHGAASLGVNTVVAPFLWASGSATDGSLGETSTVVCVMCVTDSKEAVWLTACHPQALECFCSSLVPACLSDVDFSSLNFTLNYGHVSPKKSVLSCPYLLLINHIRISLCQQCCLFLCSFIMIGTELERRTLKWLCFMWTWSVPVQTSHSGWTLLLLLSPGLHGQCQHIFCSRDVITLQTAASLGGCSSSFSLVLLSLVLSFCPWKT